MLSSLECCTFPQKLKEGIICLLHKVGSRADAINCRPISLATLVSKIMHLVDRKRLATFLKENDLLTDSQHGPHPRRSYLINYVYVIYLDFVKVDLAMI